MGMLFRVKDTELFRATCRLVVDCIAILVSRNGKKTAGKLKLIVTILAISFHDYFFLKNRQLYQSSIL